MSKNIAQDISGFRLPSHKQFICTFPQCVIRSDEGSTLDTSAFVSQLEANLHITNSAEKTKLSCNTGPRRRSMTDSLETNPARL